MGVVRVLLVLGLLLGVRADARAEKEAWPRVVTQAWLAELAQRKWPIAGLVEERHGLVALERVVDSDGDDAGVVSARRLCGARLRRALPALERRLFAAIRRSDVKGCRNRPGPPRCVFGVAHEHTIMTYLVFRALDGGDLVLDAVMFLDGGMQDDDFRKEQNRHASAQMLRLRKTDCAGNPTPFLDGYRELRLVEL